VKSGDDEGKWIQAAEEGIVSPKSALAGLKTRRRASQTSADSSPAPSPPNPISLPVPFVEPRADDNALG